jgi:hypothetical protein
MSGGTGTPDAAPAPATASSLIRMLPFLLRSRTLGAGLSDVGESSRSFIVLS